VTPLTSAEFSSPENITKYSYRELARATSNFDQANKIGEGGYGPVYKVIEELVCLVLHLVTLLVSEIFQLTTSGNAQGWNDYCCKGSIFTF
jgi:hypothetical protein